METVEYLVIAVAADLVLIVDEAVVDVAVGDELGHHSPVLGKDGSESLDLRLLLAVYPHSVTFLHTLPYIGGKEFEVLVEDRLRHDAELHRILVLAGQRKFHIYPAVLLKKRPECPVGVHIRRVEPHQGVLRKDVRYLHYGFLVFRNGDVRIDLSLLHLCL